MSLLILSPIVDKCKFKCTRIPFVGHIISANGLQPDPREIESILSMYSSTSLARLQIFPGMVQFLSLFIPNLASTAAHLWSPTKKTREFVCSPEHRSSANRIKKVITTPTSLQYFDSTQPVTIQVDASKRGICAVLLQANCPEEFASKLLFEALSVLQYRERNVSCPVLSGEVSLLCLWPTRCGGV